MGAGINRAYTSRGGGFYIDIGCSSLIAYGKIKVKRSPEGITSFSEGGLLLKDGSSLDADIVVLATGYNNMRTTCTRHWAIGYSSRPMQRGLGSRQGG